MADIITILEALSRDPDPLVSQWAADLLRGDQDHQKGATHDSSKETDTGRSASVVQRS